MRKLFLTLFLVTLAACAPSTVVTNVDPCQPATYNEVLCQQAVAQQGFYNSQHIFIHHVYVQPFVYYRGGYNSYIYRRRTTVIVPHTYQRRTIVVPRSTPYPRTYYRYRR